MRSSREKPDTHVVEHCGTPKITRRWKGMGTGAMWRCTCGQQFWLKGYYGHYEDTARTWEWVKV